MLRPEEIKEIEHELAIVPYKRAACIEALKAVNRHRGWVSDDGIRDVAEFLDLSPDEVDSVATFYNLIFRRPVGRHVILLCDSVSCWIMGYDQIRRCVQDRLAVGMGETTADNRFTLLPIQCLGWCDHAPACMVDEDLHGDLTVDTVPEILEGYG